MAEIATTTPATPGKNNVALIFIILALVLLFCVCGSVMVAGAMYVIAFKTTTSIPASISVHTDQQLPEIQIQPLPGQQGSSNQNPTSYPQTTPTLPQDSVKQQTPTSWKTYTNNLYGVTLLYPANFTSFGGVHAVTLNSLNLDTLGDITTARQNSDAPWDGFSIDYDVNKDGLALADYAATAETKWETGPCIYSASQKECSTPVKTTAKTINGYQTITKTNWQGLQSGTTTVYYQNPTTKGILILTSIRDFNSWDVIVNSVLLK